MLIRYFAFFLMLSPLCARSQNSGFDYLGKNFEVGSSLTYIWDTEPLVAVNDTYHELTWNINSIMRLHKRIWFGVQAAPVFASIRADGNILSRERFYLAGLLVQYNPIVMDDRRLFLELSANRSNMVHSFVSEPYKQSGVNYLGLGGGVSFLLNKKISRQLYLEIGFHNYLILNDIHAKSNYTQYILGLNYRFGKI